MFKDITTNCIFQIEKRKEFKFQLLYQCTNDCIEPKNLAIFSGKEEEEELFHSRLSRYNCGGS